MRAKASRSLEKASRSLENPDDQIARQVADALSSFGEHFTKVAELEGKNLNAQTSLLKSAKFKKTIAESEPLQTLAKETDKALQLRSKNLAQQQEEVKKGISQALEGLEKMQQ